MKSLNELFSQVILSNELSNNINAALRFSDPDGVLSGKSGWSFGKSQFDTQNNGEALKCLAECGFTALEIKGIVNQTIDVKPFAARLKAHKEIIEQYDEIQLGYCINQAMNVITKYGVPVDNPSGILALADYVNQYGSIGNGFVSYMKDLGESVDALDVLSFKLDHTKYGREHPLDCKRRYNNLVKIITEEGL